MSTYNKSESFPGRTFYKSSGINWGRFMPWLLLAFVVAGVLAEGMFQLFRVGHYYIFIVPIIAALAVGATSSLAVNKGHCRNRPIAGAAGFCAGLVLYLGSYYCGMVYHVGQQAARHPEWLPAYIRLRMATDVTRSTHDTGRDNERRPSGNLYLNWGRFGFELLVVLAMTTSMSIKRSRKAYCERCQRWMERDLTPFDPAESPALLEALRNGSARSLAALCAKAAHATVPNTTLAVEYCPTVKDGMTRDCAVYISIKDITAVPANAARNTFEQSKGKILVRGMQLNQDEMAALAPRIPLFETLFGRSAVSALLPKKEPDEIDVKNLVYAEITPLPEEHAGKILTRKTVLIASSLSFSILLGFFAGMGLLFWGGMIAFPDNPPPAGVSSSATALGITLMSLGGIWLCFSLTMMLIDSSFFFNRYIRRQLSREFTRRTSMLVDLNDLDALFVERVPKTNWGKMMLDNAGDIGLLVVDRSRREIRFEGDNERWRIPAEAITSCQFEEFVQRQGNAKTRIFYVVLQANYRNGFWEAPIRPRGNLGLFSGKRKKATRELFESIQQIRGIQTAALV
jgi:hypothetical protein